MPNNIDSQRVINGHDTFSQAHQDLFVRYMTDFKRNGFYVEIGASDPIESNNSYILERDYYWNGISFEIDNAICNVRSDNGYPLGIISNQYKIVQNKDAFAFTDELVGQGVTYETAGSLSNGKFSNCCFAAFAAPNA